MRRSLPLVALALVCAAPAAAIDLPARKAGLWEIKMTMDDRNLPAQTFQHCIDAETDKLMNSFGGAMRQDMCSKQDVQQVGSTYVVDSVCKLGPSTTTSHGVVSGDFSSAYTVKVTSKREGGLDIPGLNVPGLLGDATSHTTIDAKWTGACKADQKPGDIVVAGGRKFNIRDIQNMPPMPGMPGLPGPPGRPGAPAQKK